LAGLLQLTTVTTQFGKANFYTITVVLFIKALKAEKRVVRPFDLKDTRPWPYNRLETDPETGGCPDVLSFPVRQFSFYGVDCLDMPLDRDAAAAPFEWWMNQVLRHTNPSDRVMIVNGGDGMGLVAALALGEP
jgi:hypothetical protein